MMATPMQAAYTNFAGDHFQLQSPVDVPTMIMDDLMVRNFIVTVSKYWCTQFHYQYISFVNVDHYCYSLFSYVHKSNHLLQELLYLC